MKPAEHEEVAYKARRQDDPMPRQPEESGRDYQARLRFDCPKCVLSFSARIWRDVHMERCRAY